MAWLRNKKTGGWFELPDENVYESVKIKWSNKTPKEKAKVINEMNDSNLYDKYNFINSNVGEYENISHNTLIAKNETTNVVEGTLDYYRNEKGENHIKMTYVYSDYRKKGVGTILAKELQKIAKNDDIYFDMIIDESMPFWNKIANIKEYKKGAYGVSYYKGKIK